MKALRTAATGKLVVVIDDDALVLEATEGLLRSWGFRVITGESYSAAMARLREIGERPDLIICDYRLSEGPSGLDAIARLRHLFEIPALLISADGSLPQSDDGAYQLLHKPVSVDAFRALVDASVLQR
ncbi:MAG: response regulator [Xanthobacteraceae bacterium]